MKPYHPTFRTGLLLSVLLMTPSLAVTAGASDDTSKGTKAVPENKMNVMASGAVKDSLKACLARIPENATAGQRLLAEQSCESQEGSRQLMQGAQRF